VSFEDPGDGRLCDHCNRPGVPYEYRGETFSGLTANRGEWLCRRCLDIAVNVEIDQPVGWAQAPEHTYAVPTAGTGHAQPGKTAYPDHHFRHGRPPAHTWSEQ
jgi:hypothetical protein